MRNRNILPAKILAIVAVSVAVIVLFGWIFNIPFLLSISPSWPTMKFISALCFLLSGFMLYALAIKQERSSAGADLTVQLSVILIFLLVVPIFISSIFDVRLNLENFLVKEAESAMTPVPGRPSIGTITAFFFIVLIGIFDWFSASRGIFWSGVVVGAIGAMASSGYILNFSQLYHFFGGVSAGMALHTSLLFIFLGIGYCLISFKNELSKVSS